MVGEGGLIFRVATLYYFKCSVNKKNYKTHKKTGKNGPFSGDKKQLMKTVSEGAQMLDLLDKDFKSAIINTFMELKKIMSKKFKEHMRTISQQIAIPIMRNYLK